MLIMLLLILFLAPVSFTVTILQDGHTDLSLRVLVWGVGGRIHLRSHRDAQGRHFIRMRRGKPLPEGNGGERTMLLAGAFSRANQARKFFFHGLVCRRLVLDLSPSLWDASATALAAGAAQLASRLGLSLTNGKFLIRTMPDFLSGRTRFQVHGIFFIRLGTIIITAAMTAWAYFCERARQRAAMPKEANDIGSSHW